MPTFAYVLAHTAAAAILMALPIIFIAAILTCATRSGNRAAVAVVRHETRDEPNGIVSALSPR